MLLMSVKIGFDVNFVAKGKNPIFTSTVILTYHIATNSLITNFCTISFVAIANCLLRMI